jgi:NAD(P)-dependent dehydrogenase (short-subunit alcohol dehydrogenase family)
MVISLKGQVCVITGAAGRESLKTIDSRQSLIPKLIGIGHALVADFVQANATVVAVDILPVQVTGVDSVICDQGDPESVGHLETYLKDRCSSLQQSENTSWLILQIWSYRLHRE